METIASLPTQPTFEIVSDNVILAGLLAPSYTMMEFLPKIIRKPLCAARAVIVSYPVGHTLVTSIDPDEPPDQ